MGTFLLFGTSIVFTLAQSSFLWEPEFIVSHRIRLFFSFELLYPPLFRLFLSFFFFLLCNLLFFCFSIVFSVIFSFCTQVLAFAFWACSLHRVFTFSLMISASFYLLSPFPSFYWFRFFLRSFARSPSFFLLSIFLFCCLLTSSFLFICLVWFNFLFPSVFFAAGSWCVHMVFVEFYSFCSFLSHQLRFFILSR